MRTWTDGQEKRNGGRGEWDADQPAANLRSPAPRSKARRADEQRRDNKFEGEGFRPGQLTAGEGTGLHAKLSERLAHRGCDLSGSGAVAVDANAVEPARLRQP